MSSCSHQIRSAEPASTQSTIAQSKSYLKWAGGKTQLIHEIRKHIPHDARRLIEPFVGSGVVSLNFSDAFQEILMADLNRDVVMAHHQAIHDQSFKERCKLLFVASNNNKEAFYKLRDEFNQTKDERRRAELFLFLNRHCYNGLCRYSQKSGFNTPFGQYKSPYFPDKELDIFASKLQEATIWCADFKTVMSEAQSGDFIYCDPPYLPLTETANFSAYMAGGFSCEDQKILAELAESAAKKGATVVISNHDTTLSRSIYKNAAAIHPIQVSRTISCQGASRVKAQELMAVYQP